MMVPGAVTAISFATAISLGAIAACERRWGSTWIAEALGVVAAAAAAVFALHVLAFVLGGVLL